MPKVQAVKVVSLAMNHPVVYRDRRKVVPVPVPVPLSVPGLFGSKLPVLSGSSVLYGS